MGIYKGQPVWDITSILAWIFEKRWLRGLTYMDINLWKHLKDITQKS